MTPFTDRELVALVGEHATTTARVAAQAANAIEAMTQELEGIKLLLIDVRRELSDLNEARASRERLVTRLAPLVFALVAGIAAALGLWRNPGEVANTHTQGVTHETSSTAP